MLEKICGKLNGKNILILGFGREGQSTYKFIRKYVNYKSITISDKKEISADGARYVSDEHFRRNINCFDIIIKSPGIVLSNPDAAIFDRLTSQTELFLEAFSNQIIGITGTKGKSTTSTLMFHILKSKYPNTLIMGNIGIPALDMAENINEHTIIVYELSAHQLEYTKVSPKIAVLLNLHPDHLDHYGTYENYINAKKNIYRFQNGDGIFFCNAENAPKAVHSKLITISDSIKSADVFIDDRTISYKSRNLLIYKDSTKLLGSHNVFNIAVVYAVCCEYSVSENEFLDALKTYTPLSHRLEFIGEKDGIRYYDDSISTICETTIQAIKSLENIGSVIIGGMDRGIDYSPLADFLKSADVDNIILIPDTGMRIYPMLDGSPAYTKAVCAESLKDAVRIAKSKTKAGKICVMSPAAASYGFFENFEERGKAFKKYIFE